MFNCWVAILCDKMHRIVSLGGWLTAEGVLLQTLCYAMFNCWVAILCGKIHRIVSLGGWLAAEAVLLQTLCYDMLCYVQLLDGQSMRQKTQDCIAGWLADR